MKIKSIATVLTILAFLYLLYNFTSTSPPLSHSNRPTIIDTETNRATRIDIDLPSRHPLDTSIYGLKSSYIPSILSSDLKIYIYDLPTKFNNQQRIENPKCDSTMFSAEVAIHQYLLNNEIRTLNPYEADLFFVPVYSTCKWTKWANGPDPWEGRLIVSEAIMYVKNNFPFWDRYGGRNHFVAATHDFGQCFDYKKFRTELQTKGSEEQRNTYSNSGPLEELSNVIVLSTFGSPNSPCYNEHKDIVIPPYIALPPTDVSLDGRTLKASWKVDMTKSKDSSVSHNGIWTSGKGGNGATALHQQKRDSKVFFLGQLIWKDEHGNIDQDYSFGLRSSISKHYTHKKTVQKKKIRKWNGWGKKMHQQQQQQQQQQQHHPRRQLLHVLLNDPFFDVGAVERDGTGGLPHDQYMAKLRGSVFCLAPAGFAPWSRRLFEVIIEGCIPVIVADDIVLPFENQLNWKEFSVTVSEAVVKAGKLKEFLIQISNDQILQLQKTLMATKESIMWRFPTPAPTVTKRPSRVPLSTENAFCYVIRELSEKATTWSGVRRNLEK